MEKIWKKNKQKASEGQDPPPQAQRLILRNIRQLVTVSAHGASVKTGRHMRDLGLIEHAALWAEDGVIRWCGPDSALDTDIARRATVIDASGMTAMPGFIDAHTHAVFGGSRENEFALRAEGATYRQIADQGGGILSTVKATRAASQEELKGKAARYLDAMLRQGTLAAEIKSGYGLDSASELKMLRVIDDLAHEHTVEIVSTFLGAHAFPVEYRHRRRDYIALVCEEMLPQVAQAGLARFCDVFCEQGFFSVDQSRTILQKAQALGFELKVHADELAASGGSLLAAEMGAVSADHLEYITPEGIQALARAGTVAVLLPGVDFFLHHPYANARALIDGEVAVALATDFNPGSCMCYCLPLMMTMACAAMKMTPEEAVTAITLNAAAALKLSSRLGSLDPGKQADILLLDIPDYRFLAYHFGENPVAKIIKKGKLLSL